MSGATVDAAGQAEAEAMCGDCLGTETRVTREVQRFLYGEREPVELTAVVWVHTCRACGFQWTEHESEQARTEAVLRYLKGW